MAILTISVTKALYYTHDPRARPSTTSPAGAGVSKGAVSFALNGRPGVGTRDPGPDPRRGRPRSGWTPSHRARALAAARALAVGLVIARPPETLGADPFFPSFIAGIEAALSPLRPVPGAAGRRPTASGSCEGYRRLAADGRVDGVFLTDLRVDDPRPALLREIGLPAVLDRTVLHRPRAVACVSVDDRPGIRAAVEHLVGSVTAASPTWPGRTSSSTGSPAARPGPAPCADAGLRGEPLRRLRLLRRRAALPRPAELLDLADPPTAIVYANDLMAIAGIGGSGRPRPRRSPTTSRSPASTTPRSPRT